MDLFPGFKYSHVPLAAARRQFWVRLPNLFKLCFDVLHAFLFETPPVSSKPPFLFPPTSPLSLVLRPKRSPPVRSVVPLKTLRQLEFDGGLRESGFSNIRPPINSGLPFRSRGQSQIVGLDCCGRKNALFSVPPVQG